jgi:hypothetical protein
MALLFGLRNATATIRHLVAQRVIPSPANSEFAGMIKSITESLHDLLIEGWGWTLPLTLAGGAITPPGNVSWQKHPRDMSKASPRRRLLW